MKRFLLILSLLVSILTLVKAQVPVYESELSSYTRNPPVSFFVQTGISGIAIAPDGNVYVGDQFLDIQIFNSSGVFQSVWANEGLANLKVSPNVVKIDAAANVYVIEYDNGANNPHIVTVYRNDGSYLRQLGSTSGSTNGKFNYPEDLVLDASGNIYVADGGNNRVQVFNSAGVYQTQWGSQGTGNGQFTGVSGITVDGSGNVYVVDEGNSRIQKFNSSGTYLTSWGTAGTGNGQFTNPNKIAVNPVSGNLFVTEDNRIQEFTNTGVYVNQFSVPFAENLVFDASGIIYVTRRSDVDNVIKYTSSGSVITQWGEDIYYDYDQLLQPAQMAFDPSGKLYVVDASNGRGIKIYTANGTYIETWRNPGTGDGQFYQATGIAIDASGNIYISETRRIQKFDSNKNFITKWGSLGTGNGQFGFIRGIAVDASNLVYVSDSYPNVNDRVQKFSSTGSYISQWGVTGSGNGQFNLPGSIAIDASGNVYVSDEGNFRIQKFTNTGSYLTQWGSIGSSDGQFGGSLGVSRMGLSFDPAGYIYVADYGNIRIQKFSNSGTFLLKFGTEGTGTGEILGANDVIVSSTNKIFVGDSPHARVLMFSTSGTTPIVSQNNNSTLTSSVYPNPSTGNLTIETEEEVQSVTLINALGQRETHTSAYVNTNMKGLLIVEIKTDKGVSYQKVLME